MAYEIPTFISSSPPTTNHIIPTKSFSDIILIPPLLKLGQWHKLYLFSHICPVLRPIIDLDTSTINRPTFSGGKYEIDNINPPSPLPPLISSCQCTYNGRIWKKLKDKSEKANVKWYVKDNIKWLIQREGGGSTDGNSSTNAKGVSTLMISTMNWS